METLFLPHRPVHVKVIRVDLGKVERAVLEATLRRSANEVVFVADRTCRSDMVIRAARAASRSVTLFVARGSADCLEVMSPDSYRVVRRLRGPRSAAEAYTNRSYNRAIFRFDSREYIAALAAAVRATIHPTLAAAAPARLWLVADGADASSPSVLAALEKIWPETHIRVVGRRTSRRGLVPLVEASDGDYMWVGG